MTFYFDMDGTIADLYGFSNWLEFLENEDTLPYAEAAPMVNAEILRLYILILKKRGYNFGIISWTSRGGSKEYNREVRKVKIQWLEEYFPGCFDEIHVVKYGTPKHKVAKDIGVLFDDEAHNIESWDKGRAMYPNEIMDFLGGLL